MPDIDTVVREQLDDLKSAVRFRAPQDTTPKEDMVVIRRGKTLVNFSSNDYFGLSKHPKVVEAARQGIERYGAGSGASRLITGNLPLTSTLEEKLADMRGTEAACVFGSGYLANIGTIPALMFNTDVIFADKWVHACIIDGARLSGAKLIRYRHNDMVHLQELLERHREYFQNALIVTDAVFSMDGDLAPIDELSDLAKGHDAWLMTDDAHGFGSCGEALNNKAGKVDIQMGTLSKGVGAYGGYICASQAVIDMIKSTARSLIFSTALPPSMLASSLAALRIIEQEPERRSKALQYARRFVDTLNLQPADSPIVPLIMGDNDKAMDAAMALEEKGHLVAAIRPPTVPEGTARLRFSFSASHTDEQVSQLIAAVQELDLTASS